MHRSAVVFRPLTSTQRGWHGSCERYVVLTWRCTMSIGLRIGWFALICWGFAAACSPKQDPATVPKAAVDAHPQALPNEPLADKPAEPKPASDTASGTVASVEIRPWSSVGADDSKVMGVLQFAPTSSGMEVSGALKDLPKGLHGLHIHENGDCGKPGGHFAPTGNPHGDPATPEHHLGDLGNVEAAASNQAVVSINVPGLALNGQNSVLGHALVVDARADDMSTQPSGSSGDVIGCGVIM